jgi:hypothetical protein
MIEARRSHRATVAGMLIGLGMGGFETGKKWGRSGGLRLCLLPGACVKLDIPTAEGAT